ncbi:hypothetical protein [Pseudarthrobacter sp. MEB009]|uniref:hypothetical protein n=1 Tax=Pseudarthrobacter sp. MEB009 TaxID=3040326 RepID=UPI00255748BB|nr:hypothetical protein [Pseudarthrobacter sp. MEB009]
METTPDNPAGPLAGRRRLIIVAVVLALLLIAGTVWATTRPGVSPTAAQATEAASAAPDTSGPDPSAAAADPDPSAAPASADPSAPPAPVPAAEPPQAPAPEAAPAVETPPAGSDEELAAVEQPVAPAVPLVGTAVVKTGVSAAITDVEAVNGEATGIGEVAGPALRFKITVKNDTAAEISLDPAVINVSYGADNSPASSLSGPGPEPFPATVAPGASATGIFVFGVPKDSRGSVKIFFNLDAGTPIAAFEGQAPA